MIDMLARVQRMYETTESISSGSGIDKKYERNIQLNNESDENIDRRLFHCCFCFAIKCVLNFINITNLKLMESILQV